ncbi:hypothetical protein GCM10027436_68880 [Actinophytocola sediminis]
MTNPTIEPTRAMVEDEIPSGNNASAATSVSEYWLWHKVREGALVIMDWTQ